MSQTLENICFCDIMIIRNITNILDTSDTKTEKGEGEDTMEMTGIEKDFLNEVRKARPEDCKAIIEALYSLEGREDEAGELTSLGLLTGAIIEELMINGILKRKSS